MAVDNSRRQQGDSMSTTEAAPARTGADKSVAATLVRRRPSDFACKQVMAVTGLVLGLFVLMHMVGNLKAYRGRGACDSYGCGCATCSNRRLRIPVCCG